MRLSSLVKCILLISNPLIVISSDRSMARHGSHGLQRYRNTYQLHVVYLSALKGAPRVLAELQEKS
jgi:hypothetical protein